MVNGLHFELVDYKDGDGVTIRDSIGMPVRFIRSPFHQGVPISFTPFPVLLGTGAYLILDSGIRPLTTRHPAVLGFGIYNPSRALQIIVRKNEGNGRNPSILAEKVNFFRFKVH